MIEYAICVVFLYNSYMSQRGYKEKLIANGIFLGMFALSLLGIAGAAGYNRLPSDTADPASITEPGTNGGNSSDGPSQDLSTGYNSTPPAEIEYALSGPRVLEDGTQIYILHPLNTEIHVLPGQDVQAIAHSFIQTYESPLSRGEPELPSENLVSPLTDFSQAGEPNQSPSVSDGAGDDSPCYLVVPPGNDSSYYTNDPSDIKGVKEENENNRWYLKSRIVQMPKKMCVKP